VASPEAGQAQAFEIPPAECVTTVLSCLAVDRRLGGVLFVGLPPGWLAPLGAWLCHAIGADPAGMVTLGSAESEDDLWCRPLGGTGAPAASGGSWLLPGPGRLAEPPHGPPVAIIPDLARASLAVTRAAVTLVGADAAVVDRHGQHVSWQPRTRWLAACSRADLGRLSGHLLDRFPVRVSTENLYAARWSPQKLRVALAEDGGANSSPLGLPSAGDNILRALGRVPHLGDDAARVVVRAVGTAAAPARRDLALGRLARAVAALEASDEVAPAHVRRAAALVGLAVPEEAVPSAGRLPDPDPLPPPQEPRGEDRPVPKGLPDEGVREDRPGGPVTITGDPEPAGTLRDLPVPPGLASAGLYLEDAPEALPEFGSLRQPWQRRGRQRSARGLIVGTEPTRELADLSITATVLEAARYQPLRRLPAAESGSPQEAGRRIVIYGADLHRYRRQAGPDATLALVLDHTCHRHWQWTADLAPYLGWAYTRRAAVTVVELGHAGAASDLRAEAYRAASVRDRRIIGSLSRPPGLASPLAYGLDLAIQHLRRQVRYGAAATEEAWLVVVSDGRGNVPLEASLREEAPWPVGTEGIRDALAVAAGARTLPRVRSVVIAPPGLAHYPQLPFDLAAALGGIVADVTYSPDSAA